MRISTPCAAALLASGLFAQVPNPPSRPATVLLVTSESLREAWQPFADWKTRVGKSTRIVTVADIAKRYEGPDAQAKIRACVLEHVREHGTRWVVLGGDSAPDGGTVPDRDTPHPRMRYRAVPTDAYFISESDWDANDDGVYGNWEDDREACNYFNKNVCIGRIPVRTADEVAAYTAKIKGYETEYPTGAFARSMVYTCPERGAFPKLRTSWDKVVAPAWSDGAVMRFYSNTTPWDGEVAGDHDLTPDNWVKMINGGVAGKMHMHGHGLLHCWVLEGHELAQANHVSKLDNRNAYPVMTTVSCFTGQYDNAKDPCISESMLRKADGGAVAIVAPARVGVPVFHDPRDMRKMVTEGKMDGTTEMLSRFWAHGLRGDTTVGEAFSAAKAALADDGLKNAGFHFVQCEINLLGDPTLDMRAREPRTPTVEVPADIARGTQQLTITTDAPGATVCVWKGEEVYEVALTDDDGAATVSVHPKTAGELNVTVSGASLNAALREISVR